MVESHDEFELKECGFHIIPELPFIGASPDGLVNCKCCGDGCLEVKCPFCRKDEFIFEAADDKRFCLKKNSNNELCLDKKHPYCYQIETLLHISKRNYCHFYVWTSKDYHIERILPDPVCWALCIRKCKSFYELCVLPELVAKYFSEPLQHLCGMQACGDGKTIQLATIPKQNFCYCKTQEQGQMIICSNKNCKIAKFDMDCLKMTVCPKRKWCCPDCHKFASKQKTQSIDEEKMRNQNIKYLERNSTNCKI